LEVYKTRTRAVVTIMHGGFQARETLKQCQSGAGCPVLGSAKLAMLVMPRRRYGYDVMVQVGLERYLSCRQREEICATLRDKRGIELSTGKVSELCDQFLLRLQALHIHRAPALRAAMDGGYPLHIDATCERGRGGLFVAMDGWRDWVLWSARITSESEQELLPLVERTVELFGKPLSTVRDMGKGGAAAVAPLHSAGVVDLLCHYHFLKAVGIRLFKACYTIIMTVLRDKAIRGNLRALLRQLRPDIAAACDETSGAGRVRESLPAMIYWALEGDAGQRARFPFALPHLDFVRRCRHVASHAFEWIPQPHTELERRALDRLLALVDKLDDERMREAAGILDMRWPAFCELRGVLRVTNADLPGGGLDRQPELLPAMELLRLQQIEQEVTRYVRRLEEKVAQHHGTSACGPGAAEQIILSYLHEHGAKLFGHPVRRDEDGSVLAVVQRTNNCPEHFFSQDKGRLRQRVRHAHLAQDLEQQPAQAALAANLRHAGYVRPLCGSLENLPAAFAALPAEALALATALVRDHRDARLQRVAHELVSIHGGGETTEQRSEAPAASKSPPELEGDLLARLRAVAGLTEQELRQRCADLFPSNDTRDKAHAAPSTTKDTTHPTRPSLPGRGTSETRRDPPLPPVGTILAQTYAGEEHEVRVLDIGFEHLGVVHASLSAVACTITGSQGTHLDFFERTLTAPDKTPTPAVAGSSAPASGFPTISHPCGGTRPRTAEEDPRLPAPGTVLTRAHGGIVHEAQVAHSSVVISRQL